MDVVAATSTAIQSMGGLAAGRYRRARVSSSRSRMRRLRTTIFQYPIGRARRAIGRSLQTGGIFSRTWESCRDEPCDDWEERASDEKYWDSI